MSKSTSTHFKEKFKGTWSDSAKKEAFIQDQIQEWTQHTLIESGFGAGSTEYIEGTSASHGFDKSEPDFRVEGTDIRIEVTGPLRPIRMGHNLLINVKKVEYALEHPEFEYWMAWVNGVVNQRKWVRFVRIGTAFNDGVVAGLIVREQFESRGLMQYFHAIPFDHKSVITFDRFIQYLNSLSL